MCLLWRGPVIIVIYTDDTIAAAVNKEHVDKAIKNIGDKFATTSSAMWRISWEVI
jgi:hypothetical protein